MFMTSNQETNFLTNTNNRSDSNAIVCNFCDANRTKTNADYLILFAKGIVTEYDTN